MTDPEEARRADASNRALLAQQAATEPATIRRAGFSFSSPQSLDVLARQLPDVRIAGLTAAYNPYTDSATFYARIDVHPDEKLEAAIARFTSRMVRSLQSRLPELTPEGRTNTEAILRRIQGGELPIVVAVLEGTSRRLDAVLATVPVYGVSVDPDAQPILPPDPTTRRTVADACESPPPRPPEVSQ